MKIRILYESDIALALLGLGLSYGMTSNTSYETFISDTETQKSLYEVAKKLSKLGLGHNKFLESIQVWLDITTSRMIWQDISTYRVGITTQSESTNHTLMKKSLTQDNFEYPISECILQELNKKICANDFIGAKAILPESFLQRRIICTNYKCLQNIILQRKNHKLPQFKDLCSYLLKNLKYADLLR